MVSIEQEAQEIKAEKFYDRLEGELYRKLGNEGCLAFELSDSEAKAWDESDNIRHNLILEFSRYEFDFIYNATAQKLDINYELVGEDEEEDEEDE